MMTNILIPSGMRRGWKLKDTFCDMEKNLSIKGAFLRSEHF